MPVRKNTRQNPAVARAERRQRVASLYISGKSQMEIARIVNVTQGTISNDLAAVRKEWLASAVRDFDARISEELAKLEAIERAAWEAWLRSCEDTEIRHERSEQVRRTTKGANGKKGPAKMVPVRQIADTTRRKQVGDPRFLEQVERCVLARLRLLGQDAANRANKPGNGSVDAFWESLPGNTRTPQVDVVQQRLEFMLANPEAGKSDGDVVDAEYVLKPEARPVTNKRVPKRPVVEDEE